MPIFVTRLSILLNWLHERDPVRYDVYFTQIKVAGKAGLIDHIAVPLEQVQQFYVLYNFYYYSIFSSFNNQFSLRSMCGNNNNNLY